MMSLPKAVLWPRLSCALDGSLTLSVKSHERQSKPLPPYLQNREIGCPRNHHSQRTGRWKHIGITAGGMAWLLVGVHLADSTIPATGEAMAGIVAGW